MEVKMFITRKTYDVFVKEKEKAIIKYAGKFKLPVPLIRAIIRKEAEGNFWATRIEDHLKKAGWYNRTILGVDYTVDFQYCSFGLMQVMYGVARHNGLIGSPFRLYNPALGIKYGCKVLARQLKRYKGKISDAVAAYNQGNNRFFDVNKNGIRDHNEKYHNQAYVDVVIMQYYNYLQKMAVDSG